MCFNNPASPVERRTMRFVYGRSTAFTALLPAAAHRHTHTHTPIHSRENSSFLVVEFYETILLKVIADYIESLDISTITRTRTRKKGKEIC